MNVDKFGHFLYKRHKLNSNNCIAVQDCVLQNKKDGSLDASGRIIKNLHNPMEPNDSATKQYVDNTICEYKNVSESLKKLISDLNARVTNLETITKVKK